MTLDEIATKHNTDKASRSHFYTKYYDFFFSPYRNKDIKLLEIGIASGASLRMWKEYFTTAIIYGIDVSDGYKIYEEERINVLTGDQSNVESLNKIISNIGNMDIIIDDGSHVSAHQILSFKTLFPAVKPGGFYVIEDLHTSYQKNFLVNSPKPATEMLKSLIDDVNMRGKSNHSNKDLATKRLTEDKIELTYYEKSIEFIFFAQGICFIKKVG